MNIRLKSLAALLLIVLTTGTAIAQTADLGDFLAKKGYIAIKLNKLIIGHIYMEGTLNGVKGKFILDSGAGATVLDQKVKDKFHINTSKGNDVPAAGAGSATLTARMVPDNTLVLGGYKKEKFTVTVMDLDNVNSALKSVGIAPFDGVVGADILSMGKAVIDYSNMTLYLVQ
jgi:predicted aspartyl protease